MRNFEQVVMLIVGAIIGTFIFIGSMSIAQMNDRIEEQNKILKEMVVVMQEQVKEAQKQNAILDYNPMEENR